MMLQAASRQCDSSLRPHNTQSPQAEAKNMMEDGLIDSFD
jgi:hypothetical protein